jgi:hypothetical protein
LPPLGGDHAGHRFVGELPDNAGMLDPLRLGSAPPALAAIIRDMDLLQVEGSAQVLTQEKDHSR